LTPIAVVVTASKDIAGNGVVRFGTRAVVRGSRP
jgi:hypothetical protein